MEKLVELLNEYNRNVKKWSDRRELKNSIDNPGTKYISLSSVGAWKIYLWIISREYGFIKWLVENDKINKRKIDTRLVRNAESHYDEDGYWVENSYEDYSDIDTLLMLLSVSSSPIDDLILYLN